MTRRRFLRGLAGALAALPFVGLLPAMRQESESEQVMVRHVGDWVVHRDGSVDFTPSSFGKWLDEHGYAVALFTS